MNRSYEGSFSGRITGAARALDDGFDFVSISNDLKHVLSFSRDELEHARAAVARMTTSDDGS